MNTNFREYEIYTPIQNNKSKPITIQASKMPLACQICPLVVAVTRITWRTQRALYS